MILIISILVFLLTFYIISVDDFVFMRKNVSQIILFDIAILSGLSGLFFSRLAYASLHPSLAYLNPLVFFIIPYFPGLSIAGFLIGSILSLYLLTIKEKLPTGRIFDVMTLSLFPSSMVFFLWQAVVKIFTKNIFLGSEYALAAILFGVYFYFSKNFLTKSPWKDGSIAIMSLFVFSILQFFVALALNKFKIIPIETSIFALFLFILFVTFLIRKFKRIP